MVSADFKVRYQGSALGYLWSVLRPLFLFVILYVVFTHISNFDKGIEHFPVYLLLGIVIWTFFNESTVIGMSAVVGKGDLIRKISIPRYLTVLSSSASAFINLGINLMVVLIFAFFNGVVPTWSWLILPIVFIELFILSTALAFFLSALYVRFRDLTYIWEVVMQAGFYATPVLYPMTFVPEQYRQLILLNPVAQIMQDVRYLFVTPDSITIWHIAPLWYGLIPVTAVVALVFLSAIFFKRQSRLFAENL